MDALAVFNSLEAVFWISVGTVVLSKSRSSLHHRRLGTIASVWFVLFGISDVFEVFTGAWWRPLSLLVFKAVCVVALVTFGIVYRRVATAKASSPHPTDESNE